MSDLTPELNLALAVDDDDTADYLTLPAGLRGSLSTIDGLFNSATGHNHNGAHQGGNLQFLNLSVGGDLTVTGQSDLKGPVVCESSLHVTGSSTLADVTCTTLHATGNVVMDGTLQVATFETVGLDLTVNRSLQVTADAGVGGTLTVNALTANGTVNLNGTTNIPHLNAASPTITGTVAGGPTFSSLYCADWFRNTTANTGIYNGPAAQGIAFDGAGAMLYPSNDHIVGVNSTQTLTNKIYINARNQAGAGFGIGANDLSNYMFAYGTGTFTFPMPTTAWTGVFRAVKAWGGPATCNCAAAVLAPPGGGAMVSSFNLQNGDSVTAWCDGTYWWIL